MTGWSMARRLRPQQPTAPTPNDKISALGRKLKISGTPSIFFADGTRCPGRWG
jgi:thiol:disulfide interchange protein DsbC